MVPPFDGYQEVLVDGLCRAFVPRKMRTAQMSFVEGAYLARQMEQVLVEVTHPTNRACSDLVVHSDVGSHVAFFGRVLGLLTTLELRTMPEPGTISKHGAASELETMPEDDATLAVAPHSALVPQLEPGTMLELGTMIEPGTSSVHH